MLYCCHMILHVSHFNPLLTPFIITSLFDLFVVPLFCRTEVLFYFHLFPEKLCTYKVTSVPPKTPISLTSVTYNPPAGI